MTPAAHLIEFPSRGDSQRGFLTFAESSRSVPFEIKRVYWINHVPAGITRGGHAHRRVRQVFLCLHGGEKGVEFQADLGLDIPIDFKLYTPAVGLYTSEMVWLTISGFTPETVLLVLASNYYDEAEYIREYQEFLKAQEVL